MPELEIYWRGTSGERVPVVLDFQATVRDLKKAIEASGGPHANAQRLAFTGEVIRNVSASLADLGICSESTVEVLPSPPALMPVSAGYAHTLIVQSVGRVHGHGKNESAQLTSPELTRRPYAVAAGAYFSAALLEEGNVVVWGELQNFDPGERSVLQISAGKNYLAAVCNDGTLVIGGLSCGSGRWRNVPPKVRTTGNPDGLGVMHVGAGHLHCLALLDDGSVVGWGDDSEKQATVPHFRGKVKAVAAGMQHSAALLDDGSVQCWGHRKQCDVPTGVREIVQISGGYRHTLAVSHDGSVFAWGCNSWGQCTVPDLPAPAVAVAAGYSHSAAALRNGAVVMWGKMGDPFGSSFYGPSAALELGDVGAFVSEEDR
eukprot:Hpha_TRINITY_DN15603_c0_g5::TRINITY_DN15603_c0_g5_i1::g.98510::m.98510